MLCPICKKEAKLFSYVTRPANCETGPMSPIKVATYVFSHSCFNCDVYTEDSINRNRSIAMRQARRKWTCLNKKRKEQVKCSL